MGTNLMMVGTRGGTSAPECAAFEAQWRAPVVADEMKRLGLERPEQLGALFIGDAAYVQHIAGSTPPLIDDRPAVLRAPDPTDVVGVHGHHRRHRRGPIAVLGQDTITRMWPAALRLESLGAFEFQAMANAHFGGAALAPRNNWDDIHRLLTGSSLSTPVLWALGTDTDLQAAADKVRARAPEDPFLQYQFGLRLISERRYADAVAPLVQAARGGDQQIQRQTVRLVVYALCMANRVPDAREFVRAFFATSPGAASDPFWAWMATTFDLRLAAD